MGEKTSSLNMSIIFPVILFMIVMFLLESGMTVGLFFGIRTIFRWIKNFPVIVIVFSALFLYLH